MRLWQSGSGIEARPRAGSKLRLCLTLVWLLVCLCAPAGLRAACAICGGPLGGRTYLIQDQITLEKQQICARCALENPRCFFCGLPVNPAAPGSRQLADGRWLCERDAKTAVVQEEEGLRIARQVHDELDRLFVRFLTLPETNVTVALVDRVHLQELFKFVGHDYDCPNIWGLTRTRAVSDRLEHHISLMEGLTLSAFQATCAHEYGHAWLNQHLPAGRRETLSRDANEGFCELLAFLFMESQHNEAQQALILRNAYTRGQVHLFVEAESRYGINEVLEWMLYGADGRLAADNPGRIKKIQAPQHLAAVSAYASAYRAAPVPAPSALSLKAVFWDPARPLAVINDRTFGLQEEGKVRLLATNLTVRCLAIRQDAVRVRIANSGEELELFLKQ